ncbi:MAG TPA: 4-hydroxybenzoyl-CoA reductase [Chloroflexi bacterium]|nr:4-hydroxybenzoyl-CoA reductase [Chloroflexota bacterium]
MIRLPPFQLVVPGSLDEAARVLADAGPVASLVAGGTDLYPNMKRRQIAPAVLVSIAALPELQTVRQAADGGLAIGAGITLTSLADHPLVRKQFGPLRDAALDISTPLLRNMGTLGGNLCLDTRCHFLNQTEFWRHALGTCMKAEGDICRVAPGGSRCWAITSADLPPLLIALGARVQLVSTRVERKISLSELYRDDGIAWLTKAPDEILTELIVPSLDGMRAGYLKLRRRATFDFPALGVAAAVRVGADGVVESARIVLGAVTSRPLDMPEAQRLVGERLTTEAIASVADAMQRNAKPLHLADYTHSYRKRMVNVYATRLLERLAQEQEPAAAPR